MTAKLIVSLLITIGAMTPAKAARKIIPFRLIDQLIVFQGTVAQQTGNFILDTGFSGILLNNRYFDTNRNYFKQGADSRDFEGVRFLNGKTDFSWRGVIELHLEGLFIREYATVIDLSPIETGKKANILGIVGIRALQKYQLTIDYFSQEITLERPGKKGMRLPEAPHLDQRDTLTFRYKGHMPSISAWIDGEKVLLGLDSGTELNVLRLQILDKIQDKAGKMENKVIMGLDGNTITVQSALVENLQVGKMVLPAMETLFLSVGQLRHLSNSALDGLLGQEFLKHFRITFNFKKREIYLWHQSGNISSWYNAK